MASSDEDIVLLPNPPLFYGSFLSIGSFGDEALTLLEDREFAKYIVEKEEIVTSVKILARVLAHSLHKPQRPLADTADYYVAIDLRTNTYYICYRELLMIDIDCHKWRDGTVTREEVLEELLSRLQEYRQDYFRIFATRNGYHIFLLSKSMDYRSEESIRLMNDLGCDYYYIVYSYLRGWSVRLNKKKGETENLYRWLGDVICGGYFPAAFFEEAAPIEGSGPSAEQQRRLVPDPHLERQMNVHLDLTEIFENVGYSAMPAR